jgi:uroporphyrinogen decarboxylase
MDRRAFLTLPAAGVTLERPVNKRERMLQWLAGKPQPGYTPAAFFLHFGAEYKNGAAAARKHLEYFRATDMDL